MAQRYKEKNIVDQGLGQSAFIEKVGYIYESVAPSTGTTRTPWIALYFAVSSDGGTVSLGNTGNLRMVIEYTDGSSTNLTNDSEPFSNISISTLKWVQLRADGEVYAFSNNAPTAATVVPDSATASSRARLGLSTSKTVKDVVGYWTP